MKKFAIIFALLIFFASNNYAQMLTSGQLNQVIVTLQTPPPYQMHIEDIWSLVLTNTGEQVDVYLHGIVTEHSFGVVVDVTTSAFTLPRGSKKIQANDFGMVKVNYVNQRFNELIYRLSSAPNGSYEICIEVVRASDGEILGTGCIQHEVLSVTPPVLLYPEDGATYYRSISGYLAVGDGGLVAYRSSSIANNLIELTIPPQIGPIPNTDQLEGNDDSTSVSQRGIEKKDIRRGMVISGSQTKREPASNSNLTDLSTDTGYVKAKLQIVNIEGEDDYIIGIISKKIIDSYPPGRLSVDSISNLELPSGQYFRELFNSGNNIVFLLFDQQNKTFKKIREAGYIPGAGIVSARLAFIVIDDDLQEIFSDLEWWEQNQEWFENEVLAKRLRVFVVGKYSGRYREAVDITISPLTFTWLPPTPAPQNISLTYKIKIVEVYPHQTPYDAMQSNPLFFSQDGIRTTSFVYPVAARPFNPGRKYAWQIEVYGNSIMLTQSEIQSFEIEEDEPQSSGRIVRTPEGNVIFQGISEISSGISQDNSSDGSFHFSPNNEPQRFAAFPLFRSFAPFHRNDYLMQTTSNAVESSTPPIQIHFAGEVYGETSNRQGYGSERKPDYGYTLLTPSMSFFGIPFGLNILLSRENSSQKQSVNSFTFFYDINALKKEEGGSGIMKLFSYFSSFGIGTNYPSYSPFTMYGAPVKGLSLEFNPGPFYFATALNQNQRPIDNLAFKRNLYAVRFGLGKKEASHIFLTGIYSNDIPSSIIVDSLNRALTPQTNYVIALESKLNLFQGKLTFEGEVAGSMLTRDSHSQELVSEKIPQFLRNTFKPKLSSQFDFAFSGKAGYKASNTDISAGVRMIGPGYKTFGNPTLRTDILEVEGKIAQRFFKRQVSLLLSMKYWRDNLIDSKLFTTTTLSPAVQLGLYFRNLPNLTVSYRQNILSTNASDSKINRDVKNHLLTASTAYFMRVSDINFNSNLLYMYNQIQMNDSLSGSKINNITFMENISFKFPLVLSFGIGTNLINTQNSTIQRTTLSGNVGYTFFKIWNNSLGIAYDVEKGNNRKLSFYLNSGLSITEKVTLDLRAERNNFNDLIATDRNFNELIGRASLRIQF